MLIIYSLYKTFENSKFKYHFDNAVNMRYTCSPKKIASNDKRKVLYVGNICFKIKKTY